MNRLANEKSPYLLQHAKNPVDWFPWGEEAFAKARAEDKPIFLSAGYSTCHWCHVMEKESFESPVIAALLKEHFVSIKIDREERPDIDRIYMMFVQATTGSGGWPMSVFLTPDLKPFYGGTYFPPENRYGRPGFASVLTQLAHAWQEDRARIIASAEGVLEKLSEHLDQVPTVRVADEIRAADSLYYHLRRTFDREHAGWGNAPKFPRPSVLNFLLRHHALTKNDDSLEMVTRTLTAMAMGAMNDQLAGGFHRYSVDAMWHEPHYEKMLYDQAQLVIAYCEAFLVTGDTFYAETAHKTLRYVETKLTSPEGGFYCGEDADETYYLWKPEELQGILLNEFHRFYGSDGLLHRQDLPTTRLDQNIERALLRAREQRPKLHIDDKILTSWTSMMISAFATAAQTLSEPRYRSIAERAAAFIAANLTVTEGTSTTNGIANSAAPTQENALSTTTSTAATPSTATPSTATPSTATPSTATPSIATPSTATPSTATPSTATPSTATPSTATPSTATPSTATPSRPTIAILRRYRDGEAAIPGFLDDYACYAQALLDLGQTERARQVAEAMCDRFEDHESGGFFSTEATDDNLILRIKDDYDGAEPSGNSTAIQVLHRLGMREPLERALTYFAGRLETQGPTIPQMLAVLLTIRQPEACVGFQCELPRLN
jgi:hypothetical protein